MLIELARLGPDATPAMLCESLWLTPSSLSTVLRRCAAEGLIDRLPNPADGRSCRLALGSVGRACAQLMQEAWLHAEGRLAARLGADALTELLRLLHQATLALDAARREDRRFYFPSARPPSPPPPGAGPEPGNRP